MTKEHHFEKTINLITHWNAKTWPEFLKLEAKINQLKNNLGIEPITKFSNYQPIQQDYDHFDNQAKFPWNWEIRDLTRECFGLYACENPATETDWKASLDLKHLYNYGYLLQIREQIRPSYSYTGPTAEQAMKRYAGY